MRGDRQILEQFLLGHGFFAGEIKRGKAIQEMDDLSSTFPTF